MDEELQEKIKGHYQRGEGSIQDIARVYRLSVDEVLDVLDMKEMSEIKTQGDLIDQDEAGPEVVVNAIGKIARARFTTD